MSIRAWRISRADFAADALQGRGAERFGGRWNSRGVRVVYASGSQALAVLEMLVHLDPPDILDRYRLISIEFDGSLLTATDRKNLPIDWKRHPPPRSARAIGDAWVASASSVVLQVPSAIVPGESNFLLNPLHPDFAKLTISKPLPFRFDPRLR